MIRSRLLPVTGIAAALLAWQIAVTLRPGLIPGVWSVAAAIGELAARGLLLQYVVASLFRVTWGDLAAIAIAMPFGSGTSGPRVACLPSGSMRVAMPRASEVQSVPPGSTITHSGRTRPCPKYSI